jgi:ParB-like chromosome segregation protein Spo0J
MTSRYIETRDVPLADLTGFPGNARRGDVQRIRESVRANGQYRSLVARRLTSGALVVLAGNHTLQALHAEGAKTARCEIVECDEDTALRINLVDNRAAELGEYDDTALELLLRQLDDPLGSGWTDTEVAQLLADDSPLDGPLPGDRLPEPGDAPVDVRAEVWGVIVTCADEQAQASLLEMLSADGWDVRALVG